MLLQVNFIFIFLITHLLFFPNSKQYFLNFFLCVYLCIGSNIKLGDLLYNPPRNGVTIWEIGVPDRTAAEFFIPNPPPQFKVHKYKNNSESR